MLPPSPRAIRAIAIAGMLLAAGPAAAAPAPGHVPGILYLSPRPEARMVSPGHNIVVRPDVSVDPASLDAAAMVVTGARSGRHPGTLALSDDGSTLVFTPATPFATGERVTVRFEGGARARSGAGLPPVAFGFTIAPTDPRDHAGLVDAALMRDLGFGAAPEAAEPPPVRAVQAAQPCDTLPPGFPFFDVQVSNHPNPGCLFFAPFGSAFQSMRGDAMILDGHGQPIFYRDTPRSVWDLKLQPNGLITYYTFPSAHIVLDSTYAIVDTIYSGNGYPTDGHDLQLLANGHALLMSYDYQPVRMDTIVPGGDPDALVGGLIVQELDAAKNVVFEWRSWDQIEITDMVACAGPLTQAVIDYVHGNAVELDLDGNLLVSCRHLNQIIKIDRQTGDLIWRFGPNAKKNDFVVLNDARGFSMQHDIRRLPNGRITLFDNGNCLIPAYSRVVEYELDEVNNQALLVWEYRQSPEVYGPFMGNVQRHEDGANTIGWGGTTTDPRIADLHADGTPALEIGFGIAAQWTYRAFRFPWRSSISAASPETLWFGSVDVGKSATLPVTLYNLSSDDFTITCFSPSDSVFAVEEGAPFTIGPGDSAVLTVRFKPAYGIDYHSAMYARAVDDTQLIAIPIACEGTGVGPLPLAVGEVAPARFALHAARPNPLTRETTIRFDLPRAATVRLDVFDVRGRRVETLVDGVMRAGSHPVTWSAGGRPSGVYFYRLRADGFSDTRKIVVLD